MAKKSKEESTGSAPQTTSDGDVKRVTATKPPSGYKKQSADVVGYWDPEQGALHCIPRGAKLFDGHIDKTKPSMLIYAEVVDGVEVYGKDDDDNMTTRWAEPGELVGVWGKAGLRDIRNLAGQKTWLELNGKTKDTGKGNPMKLYDVLSAKQGTLIPITEDMRVKSAHVPTFLDPVKPRASKPSNGQSQASDVDEETLSDESPF